MLEVVLVLIAVFVVIFSANIYFNFVVLIIVLVLIAPGIYSLVKGAPYLPSMKKRVDTMIRFANLKKEDKVYDLGCGDGRILRRLYKVGFRNLVGYEFSLPIYLLAVYLRFIYGTKEKILFRNFWKADVSDADLIFLFLLDGSMKRFYREIWPSLKKGARVVVNEFEVEGVKAVRKENGVYLYVK